MNNRLNRKIPAILLFAFIMLLMPWFQASAKASVDIAVGWFYTVALNGDGTVWAWGYNDYGQLGNGTRFNKNTPVQVTGLTNVTDVAACVSHSVAAKNDGTVWAWGGNSDGQLGDGTTTDCSTPVQVTGLSDVVAVAAGSEHTVAVKNDSTVWAWGGNRYGQLGNGTTTDSHTPVQITGISGIISIAAGYWHTAAVKNDGTVWAWGMNWDGRLGDGTTTERDTPVQVIGLSDVVAVAAGEEHTVAVKSDGTVWGWGRNWYGQIGDGTTTQSLTPIQAIGLSDVIAVAAGRWNTIAVKNDGTVWVWGYNSCGLLGDGTTTQSLTPIQATGLSDVIAVAASEWHTVAVKSDGMIWGWGNNGYGQLGDGTIINNRTTPVQVVVPEGTGYFNLNFSISSESNTFSNNGGTGSVSVTAYPPGCSGCSWTAASNDSWIHINSGSSGTGNGTVNYSVDANSDARLRNGTMTIAGKNFKIYQFGASAGTGGWVLQSDHTGNRFLMCQSDNSQPETSVNISTGSPNALTWVSDAPATTTTNYNNPLFEITLQNVATNGNLTVEVGSWSGGVFYPGVSGTLRIDTGINKYNMGLMAFNSRTFSVPAGAYFAMRITNNTPVAQAILTGGLRSWLYATNIINPIPTQIIQLNNGSMKGGPPSINDNGYVVWSGSDGTHNQIYLYNGTTTTQLTNTNFDNYGPQINNNDDVVWSGSDNTFSQVFLYNGTTTTQLTSTSFNNTSPQINDNGDVVWHGGMPQQIFLYDGATITQLTNNSYSNMFPQINDNGYVTWEENSQIVLYDGTTTIQLTNDSYQHHNPKINNNGNITWFSNDGKVFLYDGISIKEISNPIITTSNDGSQINDNGYIVPERKPRFFVFGAKNFSRKHLSQKKIC